MSGATLLYIYIYISTLLPSVKEDFTKAQPENAQGTLYFNSMILNASWWEPTTNQCRMFILYPYFLVPTE